jgi:uncharacterized protein with FMN-binding domain
MAISIFAGMLLTSCGKASSTMAPETIGAVDLGLVRDGIWEGSNDNVMVSVDVENHCIVSIDYLKVGWSTVGRKAQYIRNDIIKRQSLQVDVVSGATITSKDILKAVEIALNKGME